MDDLSLELAIFNWWGSNLFCSLEWDHRLYHAMPLQKVWCLQSANQAQTNVKVEEASAFGPFKLFNRVSGVSLPLFHSTRSTCRRSTFRIVYCAGRSTAELLNVSEGQCPHSRYSNKFNLTPNPNPKPQP